MPYTIESNKRTNLLQALIYPVQKEEETCSYLLFFLLLLLALDTTARRLPEIKDSNNTIGKLHKLTFKRRPPSLIYVEPGKRLKLTCRVRGHHGGLAISWYKDMEKIAFDKLANSSRIRAMPNTLVFHSYQEEDAGNYSCLAEIKNGHRARAEFTLLTDLSSPLKKGNNPSEGMETPPKWSRKYRENLYYPAGTFVKLRCLSKGNPPPHVIWKKDGKKKGEGSTLVIRKLLSRHKGEYECIAENRVGRIMHKYNLNVIEVNNMVPPKIEGVKNQTVEKDSVAVFKCSVDNHKAPYIEWSRSKWPNATKGQEEQAETETTNNDSTKIFVKKKLTPDKYIIYLVIQNVTMEDTGLYTCKAVNTYGKTRKSAWLTIKNGNEIMAKNKLVDDPTESISGARGLCMSKALLSKYMQQLIFSVFVLLFYL